MVANGNGHGVGEVEGRRSRGARIRRHRIGDHSLDHEANLFLRGAAIPDDRLFDASRRVLGDGNSESGGDEKDEPLHVPEFERGTDVSPVKAILDGNRIRSNLVDGHGEFVVELQKTLRKVVVGPGANHTRAYTNEPAASAFDASETGHACSWIDTENEHVVAPRRD